MEFERFTVDALVWDGPVGPYNMDDTHRLIFTDSFVLMQTSVGHEVSEVVGSRCYLPVPIVHHRKLFEWVSEKQHIPTENGGLRIEPGVVDDAQWWEFEEVRMVRVRGNVFIVEGVYTGDEDDAFEYFCVGEDVLYHHGMGYVQSEVEADGAYVDKGEYHQDFTVVNGYSRLQIDTDVWDELIENDDVLMLRPVIEANTGLSTQCRESAFRFLM